MTAPKPSTRERVLAALKGHKWHYPFELAEEVGVSEGNCLHHLLKLEKLGLVDRKRTGDRDSVQFRKAVRQPK